MDQSKELVVWLSLPLSHYPEPSLFFFFSLLAHQPQGRDLPSLWYIDNEELYLALCTLRLQQHRLILLLHYCTLSPLIPAPGCPLGPRGPSKPRTPWRETNNKGWFFCAEKNKQKKNSMQAGQENCLRPLWWTQHIKLLSADVIWSALSSSRLPSDWGFGQKAFLFEFLFVLTSEHPSRGDCRRVRVDVYRTTRQTPLELSDHFKTLIHSPACFFFFFFGLRLLEPHVNRLVSSFSF